MCSLKNWLIFLAGAAFLHTLSHLLLPYFFSLPLVVGGFTITSTSNAIIIAVSALLTAALLWGAARARG